ncbi:MAG: hypothetical protein ACOZCL_16225 [Bacillota bacterium]
MLQLPYDITDQKNTWWHSFISSELSSYFRSEFLKTVIPKLYDI